MRWPWISMESPSMTEATPMMRSCATALNTMRAASNRPRDFQLRRPCAVSRNVIYFLVVERSHDGLPNHQCHARHAAYWRRGRGLDARQAAEYRQVEELHLALAEHQVLFFRDQPLDVESHKALGRYFGELHIHPNTPGPEGHPEILPIHADANSKRIAGE